MNPDGHNESDDSALNATREKHFRTTCTVLALLFALAGLDQLWTFAQSLVPFRAVYGAILLANAGLWIRQRTMKRRPGYWVEHQKPRLYIAANLIFGVMLILLALLGAGWLATRKAPWRLHGFGYVVWFVTAAFITTFAALGAAFAMLAHWAIRRPEIEPPPRVPPWTQIGYYRSRIADFDAHDRVEPSP